MGFRLNGIQKQKDVPKELSCSACRGDPKEQFLIPVSYLNQPLFQDLLSQAKQEFGYDHRMGSLTIPCREDVFLEITSRLHK